VRRPNFLAEVAFACVKPLVGCSQVYRTSRRNLPQLGKAAVIY
jgi:hypothetical protein